MKLDPGMAALAATIPEWVRHYPGATVQLSRAGIVLYSNGELEREFGSATEGRSFLSLIDRTSSERKVRRILEQRSTTDAERRKVWELILRRQASVGDPRPFVCSIDDDSDTIWLVEQLHDPRTAMLTERLSEINSEIVSAHRELSQQRARLAQAHTELQERTGELERSNAALDEFAHVISHDLQAPLRAISTLSEWLDKDLSGQMQGRTPEYLGLLRYNATVLRAMIDGVLRYARAGKDESDVEQVDVEALVDDVVRLLAPTYGTVEIQPGLPVLHTERAPLRQVFLNLVSNALKYGAGPHAHIVIGGRRCGEFTEFFVQDSGPGIPSRLHERIWTLFATFPSMHTGATAGSGTGIGLAVVRKLVNARGGRTWVDSDAGDGATFRFLWPSPTVDEPQGSPLPTSADSPHNSGR